jgi:macrolide transport system ATP-binding/permease protein
MSLYVSIQHISHSFGYHDILKDVSLIINDGERIGLVGANGTGKTTLLKIITGALTPDSGSVAIPSGLRLGYLEQAITAAGDDWTIDDMIAESQRHLYDMEDEMRDLEAQMTTATGDELDAVMARYGDLLERFERGGGYEIDYRVDTVLAGLRVQHLPRSRRFGTLSGGEKARVGLAMLLLQSPDLLLLDEPTNHLDTASLTWLEDYLGAYRGAALIVSHDRVFLNRTVNVIVEIDEHSRQAVRYAGDYDAYQRAKADARRRWERDFANQQEEIKALREQIKVTARQNNNYRTHTDGDKFIRNFKIAQHDATVAKRVRSAEERLRRIEADPIPMPPEPMRFRADFDPQALHGRHPIVASGLVKRYGANTVLDEVGFVLEQRARVVLVGPNGAGKTTLIRIITEREQADSGTITIGQGVRIGYLDQEQDDLTPDATLFDAYRQGLPQTDQQLKAMLLSAGLFHIDDLDKRVRDLSKGQQRKVQLARLMASGANLLVLDEPTNYISFDVLEEFESALADFPGPIIAASHDRRFIERFHGEVWQLADGTLTVDETLAAEVQEPGV